MNLAHEIFFNDYSIKFALEHAWRELRFDQKWCTSSKVQDGASTKRRKVEDSALSSTSIPASKNEDVVEVRPPGVKASKANAKKSLCVKPENKDMKEFSSMWEMKQKDLELKDKISDKRILESLLAKTEPLTEIEMTLKHKLICAMYDL
ncbi:glutathione S-transferase T2-like [Eutrema salsugineum]|uniref:glutathione S-transferase T2-like n=1 Tax=Eutrema salsugineum TaxID=72664 RepID=UPI000CED0F5A|nr:glutathione S-transferase T2-like [Eutrema salsugineum]